VSDPRYYLFTVKYLPAAGVSTVEIRGHHFPQPDTFADWKYFDFLMKAVGFKPRVYDVQYLEV
jgi:hypothetical protein